MKNNLNNKEKQTETKQRIVSYNKNKFYYKSKNENNSSIINNNNNNDNLNNLNINNNNNNSSINNNNSKKNNTQTLKEKTKENLRFLNKIPKFDHIKGDINYNVEIKAQNNINNNNINNKINNVKNITKFIKIDENEINKDLKYPHRNYRYNNNNINNNNVVNNNFNPNNKNRKNEKNPLNNYNKKKFEKNENLSKNNNNYNINNKNLNKNNNSNKFQNYPINNNNKNTNNNNVNNININYNKFNNYNHLPSQEEITSNNNNQKKNIPTKNPKILNNINMYSNIPNFLISQNNTNNINETNVSNPNAKIKQTTICDSIDEIEDLTMNYNEESVLKYPGYDKNQIIHIDNPSLINETKVEQNLLLQEIDTKINNENKDELEKQAILDELNNENYDLQFTINTNRPYTPPITELVPVKIENNNTNVKNNNLISEKDKNEKNMLLNSLKMNNNDLKDYENLVYDENVGYFLDTKKNIYYDLKQKN